jgi:hypothetical protein
MVQPNSGSQLTEVRAAEVVPSEVRCLPEGVAELTKIDITPEGAVLPGPRRQPSSISSTTTGRSSSNSLRRNGLADDDRRRAPPVANADQSGVFVGACGALSVEGTRLVAEAASRCVAAAAAERADGTPKAGAGVDFCMSLGSARRNFLIVADPP